VLLRRRLGGKQRREPSDTCRKNGRNRTKSEVLLLNRGRNKVVRPASRRNKGGEFVENKSPQNGLQVDGTEERGENESLRQKNDVGSCSTVITEDRQQLQRFPAAKGRATKQHNTSKRRFLPQLRSKTKIRQRHQRPNKIEVQKRPGVAQGSPE
jgi:hypothetical protein